MHCGELVSLLSLILINLVCNPVVGHPVCKPVVGHPVCKPVVGHLVCKPVVWHPECKLVEGWVKKLGPMKIKPTLVGLVHCGELVSLLSLILIKSLESANSNQENPPNTMSNRFNKPISVESKLFYDRALDLGLIFPFFLNRWLRIYSLNIEGFRQQVAKIWGLVP